ncbi:MAG: hypothetical protein OXB86_07465 [Bdellovibrionales bacterium]|nr:hypothetical protein [Bdellovibrionales bacterium]
MNRLDNFEFNGFEPNIELRRQCQEIYNLVEDRSPSESTKQVSITKVSWGYKANLKVTSASCIFEVSVREREPSHLVNELYKRFSEEIINWNRNRIFSP